MYIFVENRGKRKKQKNMCIKLSAAFWSRMRAANKNLFVIRKMKGEFFNKVIEFVVMLLNKYI